MIPSEIQNEEFEKDIDSARLADCVKKVLHALEKNNPTAIADFISLFAGTSPNYKWRLVDSTIDNNDNAVTKNIYEHGQHIMRTKFDSDKFSEGSDLAIARTLIHESIHAYLIAYFLTDQSKANLTYPQMVEEYYRVKNYQDAQHFQMVKFVDDIAAQLKRYGKSQGYNIDDEYYHDLAWGGLEETAAFSDTSVHKVPVQKRISKNIHVEQYGVDKYGTPVAKRGRLSGC